MQHAALYRGNYSGSEQDRIRILQQAVRLGVAYVDIELKAAKDFISSKLVCLLFGCYGEQAVQASKPTS